MKILTREQIREVDRKTIDEFGVPGLLLMENAGMRVVEALARRVGELEATSVVVLCGKGNNGGDGLAAARQLMQRGCHPTVFLFASPDAVAGDARINLEILTRLGFPPIAIGDSETWFREANQCRETDVVIDALLGSGLSRPVSGLLEDVIGSLDNVFPSALIVSIDVPSGCLADTGNLPGLSVEADVTVTLTAPKMCLVFPPATGRAGHVVIADIGNPRRLVESSTHQTDLLLPDSFPVAHQPRDPDTHKGDYGRILVVGGSTGKSGAPSMTGEAALRAGAGLVTVASPKTSTPPIAAYMPELMTCPLPETPDGTCARSALQSAAFADILDAASVVVVGPGLGRHEETSPFVRELVRRIQVPTVIDADGLYAFRGHTDELDANVSPRVITPHAGEMAGLLDVSSDEVDRNRLEIARRFAVDHGVHVVLKGYRSLIATPEGQVWVNSTGNAAMASAGTGDVLAGVIAGLIAQPHLGGFVERLCLAVYLHGLAGDIGLDVYGQEALTATDLTRLLGAAWSELRGESDGGV